MIYIGTREYKYGRMLMSHMVSDNLNELHDFADKLGIAWRHFQDKKGKPHYDICKKMKAKALTIGAKEVDDREIVSILKNFHKAHIMQSVCDHDNFACRVYSFCGTKKCMQRGDVLRKMAYSVGELAHENTVAIKYDEK